MHAPSDQRAARCRKSSERATKSALYALILPVHGTILISSSSGIVNELNRAEIPVSDICILFAQGTHRAQTPEEDIRVVGKVASRIKLYQHDCKNKDELVHVGDTKLGTPVWINKHAVDADKVIVVDGITTHLFAGYGGGRS